FFTRSLQRLQASAGQRSYSSDTLKTEQLDCFRNTCLTFIHYGCIRSFTSVCGAPATLLLSIRVRSREILSARLGLPGMTVELPMARCKAVPWLSWAGNLALTSSVKPHLIIPAFLC